MAAWTCPYCGQIATSNAVLNGLSNLDFQQKTKYGAVRIVTHIQLCPNEECSEIVIGASLSKLEFVAGLWKATKPMEGWKLRPAAAVKIFPDYIPRAILDDYKEAALIRNLSPKASATLSRRCLQGMIRNFWNVKPGRLIDEINAIKDEIDPATWQAIDAIRSIGNIGAHMEKDINLLVDVDPDEADLLIQLIEILINDWYVVREKRRVMTEGIVSLAAEKQAERKSKS